MIYSSKAREEEKDLAAMLETNPFIKSNLIRCCPVPVGIGFSFVVQSR